MSLRLIVKEALKYKAPSLYRGLKRQGKLEEFLTEKAGELQDAISDRGFEIAAKMGFHKEPNPMERVRILNGALGLAREEIFETMLDFPADDDAPNDPASSEDEAADN